jgi:thioesterase domain-containing protein/glutathione synthase/RimK-type ligase-like ATP-grasp enzyme
MKPRVLLAQSLIWPNVARLSIVFHAAGFEVDVIAPQRHPVHNMRSPHRSLRYRSASPRASLKAAIEASRPQLIVPCDDRIVAHLHALHGETAATGNSDGSSWMSKLIESSLGAPQSYNLLRSRSQLGALAGLPDIRVPQTDPVATLRQLREWIGRHGAPAVLKLDGTWGGRDVILIRNSSETALAFLKMQLHRSRTRQLKKALSDRDIEPLLDFVRRPARGVSVQAFVPGRLANCAIACWRGEVLASIAVEVVQRAADFGIATVVRPVVGEAMIATARSISRHLELSGIYGFDFVMDADSQQANLIEINPRATQINHLPFGTGGDFATALRLALEGKARAENAMARDAGEIALFPQEWQRDPTSAYLTSAYHDVPHEEPELTKWYGFEPPLRASAVRGTELAQSGSATASGTSETTGLTSCLVVQLRAGDPTDTLFLLAGVTGDIEEVRELANSLEGPSAIFGLRFEFSSEAAAGLATVDQMAAQAVSEILKIQPSGPYNLCGYSFGGVVAFAAAIGLRKMGSEVALLTLIVAPIAQKFWPMSELVSSVLVRKLARRGVRGAAAAVARKAARVVRARLGRTAPAARSQASDTSDLGLAVLERYRPGFYPGTLTFLQSAHDKETWCDFGKLWLRHAEAVETYTFPTTHLGIVKDPTTVRLVGQLLDARMNQSARSGTDQSQSNFVRAAS